METRIVRKKLRLAFATMNEAEKERVRYHLERGTPILCGDKYFLYAHRGGL